MNVIDVNPFRRFVNLGYRRVLPIIPPGVPVTATCAVGRKLAKGRDDRGKVPGIKTPSGEWTSIKDWETLEATPEELDAWWKMGAGTGIKCGYGVIAIDADCLDPAHAALVRDEIEKRIGSLPVRVGKAPKALYLCRSEGDISLPYSRVTYGDGDERVEILSAQFVVSGLHQTTLRPYQWEETPPPFDQLPIVAASVLSELLTAIEAQLPKAKKKANLQALEPVDQKFLVGDLDLVREAVTNCPNHFLRRSDYIEYGYAIRAALPFHQEEAFELWKSWCEKWEGENDIDTITVDWGSFKAPFRIGAPFLFDQAFHATDGHIDMRRAASARRFFEIVPAPPSPLIGGLSIVQASSFDGLPVPRQNWLVKDMIPACNVTMLGGDGATGKSLIAVQLGAAVATGASWFGYEVERGRALFFTAEDEMDELQRRLIDICRPPAPFTLAELNDLHLVSYHGMEAILAAPQGKEGLLGQTPLFTKIRAALAELRPSLLFLDTQADLFGGDENKRIHARQFIGMLQGLSKEFNVTVILLSHPSLSGMNSGSGMSGNTAWNNSVRSRLYLSRRFEKDGVEPDPDLRVLITKKANRSRNGIKMLLRYSGGRFLREGVEDDTPAADKQQMADALFMTLLDRVMKENRPVSHLENAKNFAPRLFERNPAARDLTTADFERSMERLFASGAIHIQDYGPPSKRRKQIERAEIKLAATDLFGD